MRQRILSLEANVRRLTEKLERSKEKQMKFMELSTERNRRMKRYRAQCEWLQKRCDYLIDFIRGKGLEPPFEKYGEESDEVV